jgi:FAD binding domain-containing protein
MAGSLADALRGRLDGAVVAPGDDGWDAARGSFNLAVDQRPEAVVLAATDDDVVAAVRAAADADLRIAIQGTGHGAAARGSLEGALLVRTDGLRGVTVDPGARRARCRAGAIWSDVLALTDEHRLAPLVGTAGDVHVVGYSLGGGLGWLARRHGLSANSVVGAEVVLPDGSRVRADADSEPDLFWALRGGGGNFGVVTEIEIALHPVPDLTAGVLFWPVERGAEVLHAWREWIAGAPEELTSMGRILHFPPIPEVPDFLRGQSFAVVEVAHLGPQGELDELLRPLRALGPGMDTVAPMPPSGLAGIHMDPPEPVPYAGDGGLLAELPAEAVDAVVGACAPGSPLLSLELRHLGGAVGRAEDGCGALASLDAEIAWFTVGFLPVPEAREPLEAAIGRAHEALAPWDAGRTYHNFSERPIPADRLYDEPTLARLRAVRARVDPGGRLLANHPIPLRSPATA